MKISTATSVFVNYPLEDAIEAVIQAGYDGIDVWCGRPHLYRQDHSPAAVATMRHRLAEGSLPPVSVMPAFFRYPFSLSSPNPVIRQDSISYMKDTIDNACALGAGAVLVVPTHSLRGQSTHDARAWFVDGLGEVCACAEARGIKLGVEIVYPALSDFMHATADALGVIREIGSDCLGIVLDTGHLNLSGEDLALAVQNAGDRLIQVHVNDNDARHQQNNIPGEGCFDFARMLALLRQSGYDGCLTVEIGWQYSFDPLPAATQALERMRSYLHAGAPSE
jgi:protein FrlC